MTARKILIMAGLILPAVVAKAQITVDNSITLDEAITILLGPDVEFSNVTFSGSANQLGSFDAANANIGVPTGVIMATGDVNNALGPNDQGSAALGGGNFGAADPDLDELDGLTHNDAAILEFDFVATGSTVSFDYVFASEEYPEYSGGDGDGDGFSDCGDVSDVFGFFLSGPGITGPFSNNSQNIALIPGSSQFVSIHNLNAGCDGMAVAGDLDCNYCQYYVYNGDGFTTPYSTGSEYVQYDGFTVILTAFYEGLSCGETYHIKLAIADVSDTAWDSAVFLREGSFDVTGSIIEAVVEDPLEELGATTLLEGCISGSIIIHPPGCLQEDVEISLLTSGTALPGFDYEGIPPTITLTGEDIILPVTSIADGDLEGTETLIITLHYINGEGIPDTATASLNIIDYIAPEVFVPDVFVCAESETAVPQISNGYPPFQYNWSDQQMTPTAVFNEGDAGDYGLIVTDYCGTVFDTVFAVIEPEPLTVYPYLDVCYGTTTPIQIDGGGLPYTYTFSEDSIAYNDGQFTPLHTGYFPVLITDQCGDFGTTVLNVIICDTEIPNVFSPDGDGKNDTFEVKGGAAFPQSKMIIYNRWGNVVYENDSYVKQWNGGENSGGTYFYIYQRADGKNYSGWVQMLKEE